MNADSIDIYKVKQWCLYFRYNGIHYMLRHISDCGDHWNELTNKDTWVTMSSDYTLFDIDNFIRIPYARYMKHGVPYAHIDKQYFAQCLTKQFGELIEEVTNGEQ